MQRPNNAGGPGPPGSHWTTGSEIRLESAGNTFTGQSRNLPNTAAAMSIPGRDSMQYVRYAINPAPQSSSLHFKQNWGQQDQETISQQSASSTLWKNNSPSGQSSSDQARSFLGTEQWGKESGGAPWGASSHSEPQSVAASTSPSLPARTSDQSMFGRHVAGGPWLAGRKSPAFQVAPETETSEASEEKPSLSLKEGEREKLTDETLSNTSGKSVVGDVTPSLEENKCIEKMAQNLGQTHNQTETNQNSDESRTTTSNSDKVDPSIDTVSAVASSSPKEESVVATSQSSPSEMAPVSSMEVVQKASTDSAVVGSIDQMQHLSLDSYVQQQQQVQQVLAAAQLTSYQLAMQQHALAAQQQQIAPGSVFLPTPYFIPAQGNPAAYDPSVAASQFPMMAHYSPYAGWPAYPSMLQQQMAAVAASASSQQSSSPATSQPNRVSSEMQQSPPSSSPLPPQESLQPPQSEILANMAAMQQSNLNHAMAMAGYGIIPSAYYDQTGALIINNGRGAAPVRLFAPGPMLMNGSQPWIPPQAASGNGSLFRYNQSAQQQAAANALYANQQNISGGNTPIPSVNQSFNQPNAPGSSFGSASNISGLGIGTLGTGIGSSSSTPQRRDSFSDYAKHPQQSFGGGYSHLYNSLGVSPGGGGGIGMGGMSPSPGPLSSMMAHGHHGLNSPPPSMSSPNNMMLGGSSRMFSAAPGAEAKFRGSPYVSSIGNSGSSLFPSTRIRPQITKDLAMAAGRSKLLDDFRNSRLTNPMLQELVSHIVEFSQDQHGSRFIQQKLERASPSEKQQVFNEIIGSAYQLMTDVFGNYVIQKFFEFGSMEQKLALADCIHGRVLPLALQMYGCRVIQKALESIPQDKQVEIVKELDGHLLKCVKDQNGNHVVQKCIECVPAAHLQFIVDGFKGQVVSLSSHPYGCRVMQRILEHCTDEQTAPILEELHQHTEMLVKDQYGNYVIQHILEHGRAEHKHQMVNELRGKILALSQHKFASNVIEKCVSHSSPQNRAWLIEEVCQEPDALFIMMKDQYANYVVQKMLDVAEPPQKKTLIQKIRPHVMTLRKFTYGKHIITKLEKYFLKNPSSAPPGTSGVGDLVASQMPAPHWSHPDAPE